MVKTIFEPTEEAQEQFEEIERLLDVMYGPRMLRANGDPVSELVGTILSQNTSDVNTARSFASLRETLPTWEDVIEADTAEVAEAIRMGGLSNIKAPRIQAALQSILDRRGSLDLAFLRDMSLEDAQAWLTAQDGIGPKTAACVLLFSLGMPAMPVDTHVGRVMSRLGVTPAKAGTLAKERILETLVGDDANRMYAVHVETITHGRKVCKAQRPLCEQCKLQHLCLYYRERTE
jgi:endonuclease-3